MQDRQEAAKALQALVAGTEGRSQSRRLYDLIAEIEAALVAGVRRKTVLAALHDHYGFTMTMSGFEKALKRARAQRATSGTGARTQTEQATTEPVTANLANTLAVAKPAAAAAGTSLVAANQPSHLPVVAGPAITPLNRGNLTYKEQTKILNIETAKSLDEDDFIDEWDYEEGKGDKHENSSD